DGRRLRAAMRRAAERHEARLVRGDAALVVAAGRVSAVAVDGREIGCDAVVAAAGAWTESLFEPHGVGLPIVPQRGQIVHLDLPATHTGGWPFVVGFHSHYLLSFPPNRVVAGATREQGSGFDVRLTAAGTREVLSEAL